MRTLIIIFLAEYLHWVVVVAALGFAFFSNPTQRKRLVTLTVLAAPIALVIDRVLNKIIISPRPFVEGGFIPLVQHSADNGFPSEHTLLVLFIALVLWVFNRKLGIILLFAGFLVGVGRILAGIHSPLDILGSTVIALVAVSGSAWILKRKHLL